MKALLKAKEKKLNKYGHITSMPKFAMKTDFIKHFPFRKDKDNKIVHHKWYPLEALVILHEDA
jgi:hypothetical protein